MSSRCSVFVTVLVAGLAWGSSTARSITSEQPLAAKVQEASTTGTSPTRVSQDVPERPRTVEGLITNPAGQPLPGVSVFVRTFTTGEKMCVHACGGTSTTLDGRFSLTCSPPGRVAVTCWLAGYARLNAIAERVEGRPDTFCANIVLEPATPICGKVVDEAGRPIAEASVTAFSQRSDVWQMGRYRDEATTSALDGTFTLETGGDTWQISARHSQYVPARLEVDAPSSSSVVVMKSSGAEVRGVLRDLATNAPVPNALVTMDPTIHPGWRNAPVTKTVSLGVHQTTRTLPDGSFAFSRLAFGAYRFGLRDDDRILSPVSQGEVVVLDEANTTACLELTAYPGITVRGTAYDAITSKPLAGVSVRSQSEIDRRAETDGQGKYVLHHLSDNSRMGDRKYIRLEVTKPLYAPVREREFPAMPTGPMAFVSEGQTDIVLDLLLKPYPAISGRVVDEDGKPVSGADLHFERPYAEPEEDPISTVSGVDGTFSMVVPSYCHGILTASSSGRAKSGAYRLDVKDDPLRDLVVRLDASASLAGVVVDPEGKAVAAAQVWGVYFPPDIRRTVDRRSSGTTTNDQGRFFIPDLPECDYTLFAQAPGYAPMQTERSTLRTGENVDGIRIELQKGHFLAGIIKDERGDPVEKARVTAKFGIMSALPVSAVSEKDGSWRFDAIPRSGYELEARKGRMSSRKVTGYDVDKGGIELVLDRDPFSRPKRDACFLGELVDWRTRKPVSEFTIEFSSLDTRYSVERNEKRAGWFRITGLAEGYQGPVVVIKAPGYEPLTTEHLKPNVVPEKISLGPPGRITGFVTSGAERTPTAGVSVALLQRGTDEQSARNNPKVVEQEAVVQTGADGRFEFGGLSAAKWVISVSPLSAKRNIYRSVSVGHGQETNVGEIHLPDDGTVKVRVVRLPGREPVSGITLRLHTGQASPAIVRTDDDGRASYEGVAAGAFSIGALGGMMWPSQELGSGETKELVLELGSGGLRGVVRRGGQAVAAEVSVQITGGIHQTSHSSGDGRFEIRDLPAGPCDVTVRTDIRASGVRYQCRIPESGLLERDFDLPARGITGQVFSTDQVPVQGVKVTVSLPRSDGTADGGLKSVVTDDNGRFNFDFLSPGEHHLAAEAPDGRVGSSGAIIVPRDGDPPPVKVVIGAGCTIEVAVVHEKTGNPVPGARVSVYRAFASSGPYLPYDGLTDANGKCCLSGLKENEYLVNVDRLGLLSPGNHERVQATSAHLAKAKIIMVICGIAEWNMVTQDGTTTEPWSVEVVSAPPGAPFFCKPHARLDTLRGLLLSPGQFVLKARLRNGQELLEPFEIQAGRTVRKETRLN